MRYSAIYTSCSLTLKLFLLYNTSFQVGIFLINLPENLFIGFYPTPAFRSIKYFVRMKSKCRLYAVKIIEECRKGHRESNVVKICLGLTNSNGAVCKRVYKKTKNIAKPKFLI